MLQTELDQEGGVEGGVTKRQSVTQIGENAVGAYVNGHRYHLGCRPR